MHVQAIVVDHSSPDCLLMAITYSPLLVLSVGDMAVPLKNIRGSTLVWQQILQNGLMKRYVEVSAQRVALQMMEAEIVAMASLCRELFPVEELSGAVRCRKKMMHIKLHEDNAGALILAQTIPPEYTPRSKHYAIKTNRFREQIVKRGIELVKWPTTEMLGDVFTKCLPQPQCEYLRSRCVAPP
mmetsp:Transcript_8889/g.15130  ORF Transcript_8889/g.15130 Transcript_8889/m.15130 type:complete len:184 (-) Transcript_8889:775-1326(-)